MYIVVLLVYIIKRDNTVHVTREHVKRASQALNPLASYSRVIPQPVIYVIFETIYIREQFSPAYKWSRESGEFLGIL